ncbi:hypothetical protein BD410DRAFT_564112 [Rickenella mellea]|uniref:Uncharacterized protein n=1 Tax=Rickenella mellea TaxID=50990 RepID=A0A4Y7QGU1_9AGAM|nr:hypothetical protein BD410DRAFT_564112 [Rickenella mellea]
MNGLCSSSSTKDMGEDSASVDSSFTRSSVMSFASVLCTNATPKSPGSDMDLDEDPIYLDRRIEYHIPSPTLAHSPSNVANETTHSDTNQDHNGQCRRESHKAGSPLPGDGMVALSVRRPSNPSPTFTMSASFVNGITGISTESIGHGQQDVAESLSDLLNDTATITPIPSPSHNFSYDTTELPQNPDGEDNLASTDIPNEPPTFSNLFSSQSFLHTLFTSGLRLSYFST